MTAEGIARAVADLLAHRVRHLGDAHGTDIALRLVNDPTVVDCIAIYRDLVATREPVYLYEDHPCIAPAFNEAAYAYENEHGNVIVMHTIAQQWEGNPLWESENIPDWSSVRWVTTSTVWLSGRSNATGRQFPTAGPAYGWRHAIGEHGEPLDLRWIHIVEEYPASNWDMAQLVLLGAMKLLACRNVAIVEPTRPRKERRRIERTGVRVHELTVRPMGKSTRSIKGVQDGAVPLTSVRGHFAHYGDCCPTVHEPRGKLFGSLTGLYYRPQHARGRQEHGESRHTYRLETK